MRVSTLFLSAVLMALVAGCRESGPGPAAGHPDSQPVATRDLDKIIRDCVAAVAADITALKDKYLELVDWKQPAADVEVLTYEHNFTPGYKGFPDKLGPNGCGIRFSVMTTCMMQETPQLLLNNLRLRVDYRVATNNGDLRDAIQTIFKKRLATLEETDRRTEPLPGPTDTGPFPFRRIPPQRKDPQPPAPPGGGQPDAGKSP